MPKWQRTLTRPELTEAVKDWLVKTGSAESGDNVTVAAQSLVVTITDAEKPTSK